MTITIASEKILQEKSRFEFRRYQIDTHRAKPRYPLPHPFLPKVDKVGLAKILVSELFEYNFKLLKSSYRGLLMSRPCIYGVFSGKLGGFNPIQERCVGCMRCVQEYPDVCRVDRNPEFTHFGDSFWMPEDPNKVSDSPFATVWYEAETGKIQVRGMGYKGFFASAGWDSMWTDMSEIVRPTRDGVYGREFISTQVDIGRRPDRLTFPIQPVKVDPLSIPIPLIFDFLPDNLLSKSIAESLILAANRTKSKYIFKPSQIDRYDLPVSPNLILYVGKDDLATIEPHITVSSALLIDPTSLDLLSQFRDMGTDCPIIMRVPFDDDTYDLVREGISQGLDGFLLAADYHGKDTANERFVKDLIGEIHTKLVHDGLRDKVTLISSGGIILAEHIPKAIIMGTDAIALNTSVLVALQVKFLSECKIPSQAKIGEVAFDSQWGGQRLVNLLGSWHNQLIEIMSAMGIKDVRRLRGDTGRAMFKEELEEVAFGDITRID